MAEPLPLGTAIAWEAQKKQPNAGLCDKGNYFLKSLICDSKGAPAGVTLLKPLAPAVGAHRWGAGWPDHSTLSSGTQRKKKGRRRIKKKRE